MNEDEIVITTALQKYLDDLPLNMGQIAPVQVAVLGLAPYILAAIKAAAETAYGYGFMNMPLEDAAFWNTILKVLTDHPGGTDNA